MRSIKYIVLGMALAAAACTPAEKVPLAAFSGPAGLALAGSGGALLFVANAGEDTVQVVSLTPNVKDIDFVPSPTRFFPLRIPAGPNPGDSAATYDGRYVLVLDVITSSFRLINADKTRLVRDANQVVYTAPLGPPGTQPGAMAGSPLPCPTPDSNGTHCIGRAYVALPGFGAVAAVDVLEAADGTPTVSVPTYLALGGSPGRLAAHPTNPNVVFVTDTAFPDLIRIDVGTGQSNRTYLGAAGAAVAVTPDGSMVLVARPELRDVLILTNGDASAIGTADPLTPFDANSSNTPVPGCVPGCIGADLGTCSAAHPADQELCTTGSGYGSGPNSPYRALYFGGIPAQIATFGVSAGHPAMSLGCVQTDQTRVTRAFNAGAAVVTLDGTVTLVGLRDPNNAPAPELVDLGYCQGPQLAHTMAATADQILDPCPAQPAGRKRYLCATEPGGTGGMLEQPGRSRGQLWDFVWEGFYPQLDRSNGGGQLSTDGNRFTDANVDYTQLDILPASAPFRGDVLEVLTPPLVGIDACRIALSGDGRACALERRIAASDGRDLILDRPLPPECFPSGQNISYRIRVGDAFLVTTGTDLPMRMRPGDYYGPGYNAGNTQAVSFRINSNLKPQGGVLACDRYHDDGTPAADGMDPVLARGKTVELKLNDPFMLVQTGLDTDPQTGATIGPVGRIPAAVLMTRPNPNAAAALFVSYAASDSLLVSVPFDPVNITTQNNNKVLR